MAKLTAKDIAYYKKTVKDLYDQKAIADYDCDYDNPQYNKVVNAARNDITNRKPVRKSNAFSNKADYNMYLYKLYDFATSAEYGIPW